MFVVFIVVVVVVVVVVAVVAQFCFTLLLGQRDGATGVIGPSSDFNVECNDTVSLIPKLP